jgi:hypothetical protein
MYYVSYRTNQNDRIRLMPIKSTNIDEARKNFIEKNPTLIFENII